MDCGPEELADHAAPTIDGVDGKPFSVKVLDALHLSMSAAICPFLRQVVLHRGIPFDVKLPNALMRQYLPKSTDLTQVAPEQLRAIVHALNRRPRKCLGFASPFEVFHAQPPG